MRPRALPGRLLSPAPTVRVAGLLAMMALVAGACDGSVPAPDATMSDGPTAAAVDPSARPDAGTPSDAPSESTWSSPLTEFLDSGMEVDEAGFQRQQDDYHAGVIACMAAEGFDYIPPDEVNDREVQDTTPWSLPRDEFVASYGYGITTIDQAELPVFEDPNKEQLAAMSPPERTAFHLALHGEMLPLGEDGYPDPGPVQLEDPGSQDRGCAGRAADEVFGSGAPSDDGFAQFDRLLDDMAALHDRISQDPRVVDATRAWSDCMAAAGHPFDTPDDARAAVEARALAAQGGTGDAVTTGGDGLASREVVSARGGLDELDPEQLEELRTYELEVAGADHACALERDLGEVQRTVRTELEEAFIDERRAELEAYRDLIASGGGGVG